MQLQIKPGLRQLWRGPQTLQIGLDAGCGTVVDGLTGGDRLLIERLTTGVSATAAVRGSRSMTGGERARELVQLLSDAGVLVRSWSGKAALTRLGPRRQQLEPDAVVWSLVHETAGDGWQLLADRSRREVEVVGAGRTGSSLATMLAAAGIGRVLVRDPEVVRPQDVTPAGPGVADVGQPRQQAVRQALDRIGHRQRQPSDAAAGTPATTKTPATRRTPGQGHGRGGAGPATTTGPDLVVLVEHTVADALAADPLLAGDVPHLSVVIGETGATVGPLVVPGRGPCLRCLDLHRSARDPAWPHLLAQLHSGHRAGGPEESTCASLAAALACLQVLAHLDGSRAPAALAATLEIELPDGLISRRSWPAHPACGCHWPPAPVPPTDDGAHPATRTGSRAPEHARMVR